MKPLFFTLLCIFFLTACGSPATTSDTADRVPATSAELKPDAPPPAPIQIEMAKGGKLTIVNKKDYDPSFIGRLKDQMGDAHIILDGKNMIFNKKDTVLFPDDPPINERLTLVRKKDELAIALLVKRVNQTTIHYRLELSPDGKKGKLINGMAHLEPMFFLGAETDTDDRNGESYFSTEYSNIDENCYTIIRIGKMENSSEYLGKLIKNCNDNIQDITLESFPVLYMK